MKGINAAYVQLSFKQYKNWSADQFYDQTVKMLDRIDAEPSAPMIISIIASFLCAIEEEKFVLNRELVLRLLKDLADGKPFSVENR